MTSRPFEFATSCEGRGQQPHLLEALILERFSAARTIRDSAEKHTCFLSIARDILLQAESLLSPRTLAVIEAQGWGHCLWNANWNWQDKVLAEVGPPDERPLSAADLPSQARHELRLFNLAMATVHHFLWTLARHEFLDPRRSYSRALDGEYPLRTLDGKIVALALDRDSRDIDPALLDQIAPFIDPTLAATDRAALYHRNLRPGRIEERHLQGQEADAKALLGQWGTFAQRRIPRDTCVGLYGGTLLSDDELIMVSETRYLARMPTGSGETRLVNGENIMSLANTTFRYDKAGAIVEHDADSPNLFPQRFWCMTADGIELAMLAFFTREEIAEGDELRWNYGYTRDALARNGLR